MKKLVFVIIGTVLFLGVTFNPGPEAISPPAEFTMGSILTDITTPKALSKFMKKHFEFREDWEIFAHVDHWQSPEEFWQTRTGDCEDYALFSQKILQDLGHEAHVVSFYGPGGYGHTVTVFRFGEYYQVMNEDRYYSYKAKSIGDAITKVYPMWLWGAIAEKRGTRGWPVEYISK